MQWPICRVALFKNTVLSPGGISLGNPKGCLNVLEYVLKILLGMIHNRVLRGTGGVFLFLGLQPVDGRTNLPERPNLHTLCQ